MMRRIVLACALPVSAAPWALALYLLLTLASGGLPVAGAWLTKLVLDALVAGGGPSAMLVPAVGLALVGLVAAGIPEVTQYLRGHLDRTVGLVAQDRLFTAVDRFTGLGRFENPGFLDRLRLAQVAGGVSPNQAVDGIIGVGRATVMIAGFLGSMLVLSPAMTILVLGSGIPTLVAEMVMSRRRARMFWEVGTAERREFFYSQMLSSVQAAKEVRLFGIGDYLRHRMLAERRTANAAKRSVDRREVLVQASLGLLAALVSGAGLLWAVNASRDGRFTPGDVTVFVAAVAGVQGGLASLASEVARAQQALLMFDHYVAVTTAGPDLPVTATPHPVPALRHAIELRDVWFRYAADHPWILRGVTMRIDCGSTLALVGLNGAGKSTLVKLLCRFYDPDRGAVLWDGVDLRDLDPAALRQRIGAVFQDYMDYDMTATENIAMGDLTALTDEPRIRSAAQRAGLHDKLAGLPHGYNTLLSRNFLMNSDEDDPSTGVVLSRGQWQRLALARALLRDRRDLMILDEPSSGLDPEAEHEIHTSLLRHRSGQTSLLISHRLSAVRDADQIVVLADGRITECGDHTTLLATGGEYARLFTLQAAGYQELAATGSADYQEPAVTGRVGYQEPAVAGSQ